MSTLESTHPIGHRHTRRCWFDHREARWVCPAVASEATRSPEAVEPVEPVDVRDMVVVHTAMLRELRLLPDAVATVAVGDSARAAVVDRHLGLLCDLLHHHHSGEDELLWPVLRPRVTAGQAALLDVAEAQHAGIDAALGLVTASRARWHAGATAADRDALVTALRRLHVLLAEHLEAEERELLPLASVHLTRSEWGAVGEAGAASVPKPLLMLVFGMFAYEGDPAVLRAMLAPAPAPVRFLVPRVAPRVYARRARAVYGTSTP